MSRYAYIKNAGINWQLDPLGEPGQKPRPKAYATRIPTIPTISLVPAGWGHPRWGVADVPACMVSHVPEAPRVVPFAAQDVVLGAQREEKELPMAL